MTLTFENNTSSPLFIGGPLNLQRVHDYGDRYIWCPDESGVMTEYQYFARTFALNNRDGGKILVKCMVEASVSPESAYEIAAQYTKALMQIPVPPESALPLPAGS